MTEELWCLMLKTKIAFFRVLLLTIFFSACCLLNFLTSMKEYLMDLLLYPLSTRSYSRSSSLFFNNSSLQQIQSALCPSENGIFLVILYDSDDRLKREDSYSSCFPSCIDLYAYNPGHQQISLYLNNLQTWFHNYIQL